MIWRNRQSKKNEVWIRLGQAMTKNSPGQSWAKKIGTK